MLRGLKLLSMSHKLNPQQSAINKLSMLKSAIVFNRRIAANLPAQQCLIFCVQEKRSDAMSPQCRTYQIFSILNNKLSSIEITLCVVIMLEYVEFVIDE